MATDVPSIFCFKAIDRFQPFADITQQIVKAAGKGLFRADILGHTSRVRDTPDVVFQNHITQGPQSLSKLIFGRQSDRFTKYPRQAFAEILGFDPTDRVYRAKVAFITTGVRAHNESVERLRHLRAQHLPSFRFGHGQQGVIDAVLDKTEVILD